MNTHGCCTSSTLSLRRSFLNTHTWHTESYRIFNLKGFFFVCHFRCICDRTEAVPFVAVGIATFYISDTECHSSDECWFESVNKLVNEKKWFIFIVNFMCDEMKIRIILLCIFISFRKCISDAKKRICISWSLFVLHKFRLFNLLTEIFLAHFEIVWVKSEKKIKYNTNKRLAWFWKIASSTTDNNKVHRDERADWNMNKHHLHIAPQRRRHGISETEIDTEVKKYAWHEHFCG